MNHIYSIRDFIQAQLEERLYQNAHPHLQTYFAQKAQAFRTAFQMPLDERFLEEHYNGYRSFYKSALTSYVAIRTPFSGYLEMTREMGIIVQEFDPGFNVLVKQMQETHLQFIAALLERWYGAITRLISSQDLLQYGFDDALPGPNPLDYF